MCPKCKSHNIRIEQITDSGEIVRRCQNCCYLWKYIINKNTVLEEEMSEKLKEAILKYKIEGLKIATQTAKDAVSTYSHMVKEILHENLDNDLNKKIKELEDKK